MTKEQELRRVEELTAIMLPHLLANLSKMGKADWDAQECVAYTVHLARKIVVETKRAAETAAEIKKIDEAWS